MAYHKGYPKLFQVSKGTTGCHITTPTFSIVHYMLIPPQKIYEVFKYKHFFITEALFNIRQSTTNY